MIVSRIFNSFSDTRKGFVRHPSKEEVADGAQPEKHGNHAMVVCGFSDKQRVLVVRNSWGEEFGEGGYCYIPYTYAEKYFLQACIITSMSVDPQKRVDLSKKTLDFNLSDSRIEAAILINLIDEDKVTMDDLKSKYDSMQLDWYKNIVTLGNVNNQSELIKKAKDQIDETIEGENAEISFLQSSFSGKLHDFKVVEWIKIGCTSFFTLIAWAFVYYHYDSSIAWSVACFLSVILVWLIGDYVYKWKMYRQQLRDEIQEHAETIDLLKEQKAFLDTQAHIHGTIIRETQEYREYLMSEYQLLCDFNLAWEKKYTEIQDEIKSMTLEVPYPFLAVLKNDLLERYYQQWSQKMVDSITIANILDEYRTADNLDNVLESDDSLNSAVIRGLKGFSMQEYITGNSSRGFLPDLTEVAALIPDLDLRAKPFFPCNEQEMPPMEKYILVMNLSEDGMAKIRPSFAQEPCLLNSSNAYSISLVSIARFDI